MITLATLAQATATEVFLQVASRLLDGRGRAATTAGRCHYRAPGDHKYPDTPCAAGALISDDEWSEIECKLEANDDPISPAWHVLVYDGYVPRTHMPLIQSLQSTHDAPDSWDGDSLSADGVKRLKSIAELNDIAVDVDELVKGAVK